MKTKYLIILLFSLSNLCFSQYKVDAESIFKLHLFLDKKNSNFSGLDENVTKNDSLYIAIKEANTLLLDTLEVRGNYDYTESIFAPKFSFYKLKKQQYNYDLDESEVQLFFIPESSKFILAINDKTGRSYRISGFNGNDFLQFLSDYLEIYNVDNEDINTKKFLKNYAVEGIDFRCLYKGLQSDIIDREKYKCLKRASDVLYLHGN